MAPLRQRVVAAFRDRLRAPLDHLAALEVGTEEGMLLHLLQQDVHVQRRLPIVEAHHEPERQEVGLERIEEAAAESVARQRPAQRVDDRVQRPLRFPQLLDPEGIDHGVGGAHLLPAQPGLGEGAARAFRQHRDPGPDVGGRRVAVARLAVALEAARRGAHAAHAALLDEQALGGGRGRGQAQRAALRQQVDALRAHGRAQREFRVLQLREQLAQRSRVDDRARERVAAERFRLLEHRDLDGSDSASRLLVLRDQAGELDGAGQTRRPPADEHHVHLDRFRVGRVRTDEPVQRKVRLMARGHDEAGRGCCAHGGSWSQSNGRSARRAIPR